MSGKVRRFPERLRQPLARLSPAPGRLTRGSAAPLSSGRPDAARKRRSPHADLVWLAREASPDPLEAELEPDRSGARRAGDGGLLLRRHRLLLHGAARHGSERIAPEFPESTSFYVSGDSTSTLTPPTSFSASGQGSRRRPTPSARSSSTWRPTCAKSASARWTGAVSRTGVRWQASGWPSSADSTPCASRARIGWATAALGIPSGDGSAPVDEHHQDLPRRCRNPSKREDGIRVPVRCGDALPARLLPHQLGRQLLRLPQVPPRDPDARGPRGPRPLSAPAADGRSISTG